MVTGPSILERVKHLRSATSETHDLMFLSFALMEALPDAMRFGTSAGGPCSIPFAETPEGMAVRDLFSSRPDLSTAPYGLLCRGLCGDESIVAACAEAGLDPTAPGRTVSTMALCCLGTEDAIETLRRILAKATDRRLRAATAYALIWHSDDSGLDVLRESLDGPLVDQITPHLFLARCGDGESQRLLLTLLLENRSEEIRSRLLGGWASPLIKRRRGTLQFEELRAWLENGPHGSE